MNIHEFQAKIQNNENQGQLFEAVRSLARAENPARIVENDSFARLVPWT